MKKQRNKNDSQNSAAVIDELNQPAESVEKQVDELESFDENIFQADEMNQGEDREVIERRAYEIYESRGREEGHALEDWLQAETEIHNRI